jgi:cytohesin
MALNMNIFDACKKGDLEAIRALLKSNPALVSSKDTANDEWTPLYWAALFGHKDVAELLLANGADASAKVSGDTPLHSTAYKDQRKGVAELLLASGANVNAKDDSNQETPLHIAAEQGAKEVAELLLAKGADVNAKNSYLVEPLHLAAKHGHKDVADLLLAKGADVSAQAIDCLLRGTPLHIAVANDRLDVAELLLARGSDVNVRENDLSGHLCTARRGMATRIW